MKFHLRYQFEFYFEVKETDGSLQDTVSYGLFREVCS